MHSETLESIMQEKIPAEQFAFVKRPEVHESISHAGKSRGYLLDSFARFTHDRGSVVCAFIILAVIFYAVFGPFFSVYQMKDKDAYYAFATPKSELFSKLGFWNGTYRTSLNQQSYDYYRNMPGAVTKLYRVQKKMIAGREKTFYIVRLDSYAKVGWVKELLTSQEYRQAREWEAQSGIKLFYPLIDQGKVNSPAYGDNQNAWFLTTIKGVAVPDDAGNIQPIYKKDHTTNDGYQYYIPRMKNTQFETRVLYSSWYFYKNNHRAHFLFGADASGYDIYTRLAYGARLSLLLSICVASVNLILGIIIGALEGYYGGAFDIIMERIKEIICEVPFMVLITLFQIYCAQKTGPVVSMLFAFIFFGWVGTSSTVRAQFYRYKGQEYVLAARSLGANDSRLIFKHILPNAIGFIITTSVLTIPGVIFSEANLTYLGIVNLQSDTLTSIGTMLSNGQATLAEHPHCVFFPAMLISILLICFNQFGNGLRDAFNPALRGSQR
jgi:oligopeptide transport system permease protein